MRQKNSGKLKFSPFWVVLIGAVVLVGILAVLNYQKTDKALEGALLNNENKMTDEQSLNQVVLHTSVGDITIELRMGAGAYGFSMSSNYNSRPRVAEVLVNGSRVKLIRRREAYRDLVRTEV